jgi:hypothetical protein
MAGLEKDIIETERPTIDISDYTTPRCIQWVKDTDKGSYFKLDPGFRPKVPLYRKVISFRDKDGLIRYKYAD